MMKTRCLFISFLMLLTLSATAQKRRAAKPKLTPEQIERQAKLERMTENTQRIVFIDSMVIPKKQFLSAYLLSPEVGQVARHQDIFHTQQQPDAFVHVNDLGTRCYLSLAPTDTTMQLYMSDYLDEHWSRPQLLKGINDDNQFQRVNYPFMMGDGQTFYFAAEGGDGLGGYDIYSTSWNPDTESWEMPVNLGFPFSSPYDDFLFYNTPDGKYSIFASNRETSRDSVNIYVLAYDSNPIRRAINDTDRLREIASLNPKTSAKIDNTSAVRSSLVENSEVQKYSLQADLVKSLRDSLYRFHDQIDVAELQGRLNEAIRTLQRLEMDFLSSGLSFDLSALQKETQRQVVGVKSGFTFSKNEPGSEFHLDIEQPEPSEEDAAAAAAAARQKQNARRSKAKPVEITRYNLVITPANGRALSSAAISAIRSCTSKDIIRHLDDGVVTFRIGQFDTPDPIQIIIEQLARNGEQNCTIQEETITVQQP